MERGVTGAALGGQGSWKRPRLLRVRDVSLFTVVAGHGYPLVLMHGGAAVGGVRDAPAAKSTVRLRAWDGCLAGLPGVGLMALDSWFGA